jgi:hypothetical protein
LFEALEKLTDADEPMALDRARAICEVAQTIINTAKVEVDLVKAVSGSAPGSAAFFNLPEEGRELSKIGWAKESRQIPELSRDRKEA